MAIVLIVAAAQLCMFFLVRSGVTRSWFAVKRLPGHFSARMIYAALPFGLMFLALGIGGIFPNESTVRQVGLPAFFLFCFAGFLFMFHPPHWVKPRWLLWLEQEYGYGLHILVEEAQAMGRWRWGARVKTREGLESWAQEVLENRSEDMYQAWRGWVSYQVVRNAKKVRRGYEGDLPPDRYMEPYMIPMPKHREEDYDRYLMGPRQRMIYALVRSFDAGHTFTKADMEQACPGINRRYLKYAFDALRAWGYIECRGQGRAVRWYRTDQEWD